MKTLNKIIQAVLIGIAVIILLSCFASKDNLFYLLFWTLPLGLTQYLGSFIGLIGKGKDSKYLYHFIGSSIVLVALVLPSFSNWLSHINLGDPYYNLCGVLCFILAIYYWGLTFSNNEVVEQDHSVYDL